MYISFLSIIQQNILMDPCDCSKGVCGKYYAHAPQIASKMFFDISFDYELSISL